MIPQIFPVSCHTQHIGPGSTFVAINGYKQDGTQYIAQALAQGATTIVVHDDAQLSPEILESIKQHAVHVKRVPNTRLALAQLSAQACGNPADKLKIIGITGTKGKTTSAFVLEHLLRSAGHTTALMSTVHNQILDHKLPMQLTTPQPDYLHVFLRACVQAGVEYVVMEVAAQGLTLHRVHGIAFSGIIFTNFDTEHAEFYATLDDYFAAKCLIFNHVQQDAPVLINADDARCATVLPQHPEFLSFGLKNNAKISAHVQGDVRDGITFTVRENNHEMSFSCPALIGMFNVYNLVGVVSVALRLGITPTAVQHGLATFKMVPGRLQGYTLPNGARCFIDYAHNPSSYHAVLSTLRELTEHLVVVFGCGGDRDATKRPLMGAIAAQYADHVVLTSDNPRSENPAVIVEDIKKGIAQELMHNVVTELDRAQAIEKAYALSKPGSIIVLLGKGPDEYQQIGAVKYPFSEAAIVQGLK